jgi:outer membrane protein TolC
MRYTIYIILLNILLIASQNTNALTLNSAIDILKSKNLEIKNATLDIKASKEDANVAWGNHLGKLNFIQDFARSDDAGNVFGFKLTSREATFNDFGFAEFGKIDNFTPPKDLNYPGYMNFFQSKLKYELPIFTGFKISSYSDIMTAITKIKSLEKKQIINEKTYQLKKSFYDMALLRESSKNLNIILNNLKILEETTSEMIEVGYAKKVDLLEIKAKLGNIQRLISEINLNEKLLYQFISFLLNQEVTNIETPSMKVIMPTYSNETILQNSLDIQKASTGLQISKKMIDISKSSYYPTVGAFGEVSTADDTFLGSAQDHKAYTVGARLTWNIFNGGIDSANLEKSRIKRLKTFNQVELAKKGIELKVNKLRTQINTYNEQIAYLQKEFELSNEIYKNYEGRYKEKLVSINDVLIKQASQIEKILLLQQAQNKRNERIFALEKLANGEK